VVSTGGTGGTPSATPRPRPPGLEFLVDRLMRIAMDVDARARRRFRERRIAALAHRSAAPERESARGWTWARQV
jgi:hypothetical protein